MPPDTFTDEYRDELARCTQCGKCRAVCPVFLKTQEEALVARGRLSILRLWSEGRLEEDEEFERSLWSCIKCFRCVQECPSQVNPPRLVYRSIAALTRGGGTSWLSRLVLRQVVVRRRLFDRVMRVVSLLERLLPGRSHGRLRHLPLFFKGEKSLPQLVFPTALMRYGTHEPPHTPAGSSKGIVAIFTGCLINYAYPHLIGKAIRLIEACGYTAWVPAAQVCCGTPALSVGDTEAVRRSAMRNTLVFSGHELRRIIVLCASCGRMLKSEYAGMGSKETAALSDKVSDISEFLFSENIDLEYNDEETVTYHDPCHLIWGQGISRQPRELLKRAATLREHSGSRECCGGGGLFGFYYPELSAMLGDSKLKNIADTGTPTVVTGCPGCMMQLSDRAENLGMPLRVKHTVEVLAGHLGKGRTKAEGVRHHG